MSKQFIFTTPLSYELKGTGDSQELIVMGDISTNGLDLVNDIVSLNCLKSMQRQIQERNIKLDQEHEAFLGDTNEQKELNKTKVPRGRLIEPTIREIKNPDGSIGHALGIKGLINSAHEGFKDFKSNIINKFLDAFSIAFIPTKTRTIMKDGVEIRILEDLNLLNVASTGNPVNTESQMRKIIMKAVESVEDYKAEKKDNPEIENQLEVKTDTKRTSPQERRTQARNEAISEDEDDEEKGKHGNYSSKKKKCKTCGHELKVFGVGGGDKLFRDGREIDSATNQPLNLPSKEDNPIKLEDNNMSESDNANAQTPEATSEATPESAPAETPEATDKPAEEVKAEANTEVKALKEELVEMKSQMAIITMALKKPVDGAAIQDTTPQAEIKSVGPTSVIGLCQ